MNKYYTFALLCSALCLFSCKEKAKPTSENKAVTTEKTKAAYDIFVGTYTRKESFVDGKAEGIYRIQLNDSLNEMGRFVIKDVTNPSFLTISKDKKYLFAVEELNPNGNVLSFNIENNQTKLLSRVSSHGGSPCHVGLSSDSPYLMVANYMGSNVALYKITDGVLSEALDSLKFKGKGKTARQEASHPHQAVYANKETWLVPDLGLDELREIAMVQNKNGKEGLNVGKNRFTFEKGAGPRHLVSPYVLNELNSTISNFENFTSPKSVQTISTLPKEYKGLNLTAEIQRTEKFIYASNRGHNSIAIFKIKEDGKLENIGFQSTKGEFPRNFNISPDGKYLFCANQNTDNIVIFEIQTDGLLKYVKTLMVKTPVCIQFM